jgi:hypothetical protein
MGRSNAYLFQAAMDVRASRDTLVDMLERIETYFQRLQTYTEVSLTTEMIDLLGKIMVEVLSILAMATKRLKQGRISE